MAQQVYHNLPFYYFKKTIVLAIILLIYCQHAFAKDNVQVFQDVEFSLEQTLAPPSSGWSPATLPIEPERLAAARSDQEAKIVWLRMTFSRENFGDGPLSITLNATSKLFDTFLNSQLIYSNFSNSENNRTATFQPYLIALPDSQLSPHINTIAFRMLRVDGVRQNFDGVAVGQEQAAKIRYSTQSLKQVLGPQFASAALIAMSASAFALWLKRRKEIALASLTAIGLFWVASNLQHVFINSFVDARLVQQIQIILQMLLALSFVAFAIAHYHISKERFFVWATVLVILSATFGRFVAIFNPVFNFLTVILLVPSALAVVLLYFRGFLKSGLPRNILLPLAAIFAFFCQFHDAGMQSALWHGFEFELMPFAGPLVFGSFSFVLGNNILANLSANENLTAQLNQRIETTKANLLISEGVRRQLEISNAITQERERMMREIHDGIGSSLVAALASAERQGKQSSTAVVALKSALTDLRIAVDSLEPVEGNVTTLLASLRYRIEPELKKASMEFDWRVDDVPELDWLDATNALHILRIFQEAFSNIFGHAHATRIKVECKMQLSEGRPGILIEVADNGRGFDSKNPSHGRGRKNMLERAEAVGGKLTITTEPNAGCSTLLWLPLVRARPN